MQVSTTVLWLALLLQAQYLFCMAGPVGVTSEELTEGELKLSGSGEDLVDTLNHIKDEEYINSLLLTEEKKMLYGGDIILTPQQREMITEMKLKQSGEGGVEKRAVVKSIRSLWPNGLLPYTISSQLDSRARTAITNAMNEYKRRTCIQFVERTTQKDYINFIQGSGCYSYIGRIGGRQVISIGRGCERTGIVIHEIFHALGRWHEQSRPDRDSFIKVNFNNIDKGAEPNFEKLTTSEATTNNIQYDYRSVMHYSAYAFSRNGLPTIEPVLSGVSRNDLGQRSGLSTNDIKHAQQLYCSSGSWSSWGPWSSCSATCGSSGSQARTRTCVGGTNCIGSRTETRTCNNVACSRWSQWSQWSSCSVSCGNGNQARIRTCIGGSGCSGTSRDVRKCSSDCSTWGSWSSWSPCSVTCGTGANSRTRTCVGGTKCIGSSTETKTCNNVACYKWSQWSQWSPCSVSCGNGIRARIRTCIGGTGCSGASRDVRTCSNVCSIWGFWNSWSPCSVTCGTGTNFRTRTCIGDNCIGNNRETKSCNSNVPCSQWNSWSEWSACSVTCGAGTQIRSRICSGEGCIGSNSEERFCVKVPLCPSMTKHWTSWSSWSPCSSSCGYTGTRSRTRECSSTICVGARKEMEKCNHGTCPEQIHDYPNWKAWGQWGTCSRSCNTGYQLRRRQCDYSLTPRCVGRSFVIQGCNYQSCRASTPVVVVKSTETPYKAVGFTREGCNKVNISSDIPELHTLNAMQPLMTNTVQGCIKLASSNGYLYVGVAGGYCIAGSNDLSHYTERMSKNVECIRGNGRLSPTSPTMYMDVYSITPA